MGTYNIFSYKNGEENTEPSVVVELNDDDTEIVSIVSSDPEQQEEDEKSIRYYVELGATPLAAMQRYAGSYGQVWNADGSGQVEVTGGEAPEVEEESVVSAAEDEETTEEVVEEDTEEEAAEEDVEESSEEEEFSTTPPGPAGRIASGATMALVSDAGVVVTLFQADGEGNLNYRMNGEWKPITDPEAISELSFVGVEEEALNLYDEHQGNGNLVPIQYYPPSAEGPYWTDIVVTDEEVEEVTDASESEETAEVDEDEEEAVTAALTLDGPSDLANAISAALLNSDLRWFVERRVAALGLEASLPWQKG